MRICKWHTINIIQMPKVLHKVRHVFQKALA